MSPRIRGKACAESATRVAKGAPPGGGACVDGGYRSRAFWERSGGRNGEERDACRCRVGGVGLLRGGAALVREERPASRERPPGARPGVRGRPLPRGVGGGRTPARRRPLTTREPPGGVSLSSRRTFVPSDTGHGGLRQGHPPLGRGHRQGNSALAGESLQVPGAGSALPVDQTRSYALQQLSTLDLLVSSEERDMSTTGLWLLGAVLLAAPPAAAG